MAIRIQWRRDTAANWTSANPTLSAGEVGFETDTNKYKVGDGTTAWNSIATYFTSSSGGGGTWGSITGTLSNQTDLATALSGKVATTVTVNGQALSGNVTLTTASIADSSNKRYVTDAQLTVIGNTSGTNTGDQDLSSYATTSAVAAAYQPKNTNLTAFAGLGTSLQQWRTNAGATAGEWFTASSGGADIAAANTWTAAQTFSLEDAGTNTVLYPVKFRRTSSGTPANGIGVGCQFEVETTAGNNEIGATISAETIDVTSTSEDFGLIVRTMVAGSTSLVIGGRWVGAQYRAPDGSATAPSYSFSSSPSVGFYDGGGVPALATGTILQLYWNNSETRYRQSHSLNFMASGGSVGGTVNASMCHAGDNAFIYADSASPAAGASKSRQEKNKQVTGIADATATAVFTVTVPNAAHSAMIKVTLAGSIGAGGAIGANEATGTVSYDIAIARTAGVNAVATISAAYGSVTSAVAGATTITVAGDLGTVSGAVGASNTFTIRVTITKGGGSSANHTCMAYARVLNSNASGITIS